MLVYCRGRRCLNRQYYAQNCRIKAHFAGPFQANLYVLNYLCWSDPSSGYATYELGLARLYQATADLERAKQWAEMATDYQDSGDYQDSSEFRLDLKLDRAWAQLLLAELLAEQGQYDEAREGAQTFIDRWQDADANLPEIIRANELIAASSNIEQH